MQITRVECIHIAIPFKEDYRHRRSRSRESDHLVIRLYTDEKVVGLGEAVPTRFFYGDTIESTQAAITKYLAPHLIEKDPFETRKIMEKLNEILPENNYAKAAIDFALIDIIGKSLKRPLCQILGGIYRNEVLAVGAPLGLQDPNRMAKEASLRVSEGYKTIKIKIGTNPSLDINRVKEIRNSIGNDIPLRVDANQSYTPDIAIKTVKNMEKYELEAVEQPVKAWDLKGMAKVANKVDVPIIADESVSTVHDALEIIEIGAADVLNIKLMKVGGTIAAQKIATIAEAAGIPCVVGGAIEFGIGVAVNRHFAASMRDIKYACEGVDPPYLFLQDDIVKEDLHLVNGYAKVPMNPGVGVELDFDKCQKYRR